MDSKDCEQCNTEHFCCVYKNLQWYRLQDIENKIAQRYGGLRIDFFPANCAHEDYWRYECNIRIKLSPECQVGSLLCYSVQAKTREEACEKLYEAISKDKEREEKMLENYKKM